MSSTYTEQLTIHGKTVWMPAAGTIAQAEAVKAIVVEKTAKSTDFRDAMCNLVTHGARVEWNPYNDTWSIAAPSGSWLRARMDEHQGDGVNDVLVWGVAEAAKAWGVNPEYAKRIMHLVPGAYKAASGNMIRWIIPAGSVKPTDGKRGRKPKTEQHSDSINP